MAADTADEIRRGVERAALATAFTAALAGDLDSLAGALLTLDVHQRIRLWHAAQRLARAARRSIPAGQQP